MEYVIQENSKMYNDGKRHFFPRAASTHQIGMEEIVKGSDLLRKGEVVGIVEELKRQITKYVELGHTVKIDGLGVFSPALKFEEGGANTTEMMSDEDVKQFYKNKEVVFDTVNFSIDAKWKREVRGFNFFKKKDFIFADGDRGTLADRISKTREYLERHGFITIQQYADLHNINKSTAQKEMETLKENGEYGFRRGAGGHLVLA